jgi:hypothetical protein
MPDLTWRSLCELYPDDDARNSELVGLARLVDEQRLKEIGLAGEEHVVAECQEFFHSAGDSVLAQHVLRVSAFDDTLGYDVTAIDRLAVRHKLEVKTTTAPPGDSIAIYLSRNEARVGLANPDWSLVIVRDWFKTSGRGEVERELATVGWLPAASFATALPAPAVSGDRGTVGAWQSVRLEMPAGLVRPGLPLEQLRPTR